MARKASVLALMIGIVTLCSWSTPVTTGPSAAMTPDEFTRSWNERSAGDQIAQLKCDARTTVTARAGRLALRPTCDGAGAIVTLEMLVPSDASQALVQRAVDALYFGRVPETISAKLLSEGKSDGGNTEVSLLEFQDDAAEKTVKLTISAALQPPATTTSSTVVSTTTSLDASSTTVPPPPTTTKSAGGRGIFLAAGDHAAALGSMVTVVAGTVLVARFVLLNRRKKRNLAEATLGVIDKRIGPI